MSVMVAAELKVGTIYGDTINQEYVYMPASEIGLVEPICIFEKSTVRQDISLTEALTLVRKLSLKPACHPRFGRSSC